MSISTNDIPNTKYHIFDSTYFRLQQPFRKIHTFMLIEAKRKALQQYSCVIVVVVAIELSERCVVVCNALLDEKTHEFKSYSIKNRGL